MSEKYSEMVANLKQSFDEFIDEATKGKEGRGSKGNALNARKISTKISTMLKDFRAESIKNDKEKPVKSKTTGESAPC